ncbi:hypothetical protein XBJ2_680020 [Xenorhabdus bovienii str. Jollieti]|nr:hypothetical protein XBJ2_680020 [Xenorhabdus bovienii str. Jollieti]
MIKKITNQIDVQGYTLYSLLVHTPASYCYVTDRCFLCYYFILFYFILFYFILFYFILFYFIFK